MSGPVDDADTRSTLERHPPGVLEVTSGREAQVGTATVRRALPTKGRRTVGAWCFADHFGPVAGTGSGLAIGPHPHIGLQTVTWLVEGALLHRDSLGSEQVIRPGQLNLMTAGHGVVHAEEDPGEGGTLHGLQLWVAQPDATRHGDAAFEHHAELPRAELAGADATVFVGRFAGAHAPARADTDHLGAELRIRSDSAAPLVTTQEHALVVMDGAVAVDGQRVAPGALAYLGPGRDEITIAPLDGPALVVLLGGTPFEARPAMWWNFVARDRDELTAAYRAWTDHDHERFPTVVSALARIETDAPPWLG